MQWASKAGSLDKVIRDCHGDGLAFSVAIVDRALPHDEEAENANARELDPVKWHVSSYTIDGDYVLVRGPNKAAEQVDQRTNIGEPGSNQVQVGPERSSDPDPHKLPGEGSYDIGIDDQFSGEGNLPYLESSLVYPRDPAHRRAVLARSKGFCEYCGIEGFLKSNGKQYLETHHVIPLSSQGDDDPKNMIALCANDHRQAHYSVNNELMRQAFLAIIKSKQ